MSAKSNTQTSARRRLSPEVRRTQILDSAKQLVLAQGFLPLPIEALAQVAGSSKALIYTYFPTQYEIFNALIGREFNTLKSAGMAAASEVDDLQQAALLSAMIYFEHVAQTGPLLKILLTDLYMADHVNAEIVETLAALKKRLCRLLKRSFPLTANEVVGAIEMLKVIPEEAGNLAYNKQVDATTARQLCHTLMLSSLEALRSPNRALAVSGHHGVRPG